MEKTKYKFQEYVKTTGESNVGKHALIHARAYLKKLIMFFPDDTKIWGETLEVIEEYFKEKKQND